MSPESILTCPACGYGFNYLYTPWASANAARFYSLRSFRCPSCGTRQRFSLDRPGHDPDRATYDDRVRASDVAIVVAPVFVGIALTIGLLALGIPPVLGVVPAVVGPAATAGYVLWRVARGEVPLASGVPAGRPLG